MNLFIALLFFAYGGFLAASSFLALIRDFMKPGSVTLAILWYDLWIGAFWDRKSRVLYLCPLPTIVIRIQF